MDSSGHSGEQLIPGTSRGGTHLGKVSVGDVCYPAHLALPWFVSPPSHPEPSPLCWCSPRRVVEPRAPAALGSDADLCHQGSGLGKDALQLAEQGLNRHSLGWKVYEKMQIYSAKIVTRELLSRAERVRDSSHSVYTF